MTNVYAQNTKLLDQAAAGDMTSLLAKLRSGTVPMSGPPSVNSSNPGDVPSDDLWLRVESARMDGRLTAAQYSQALDAVRQGAGARARR